MWTRVFSSLHFSGQLEDKVRSSQGPGHARPDPVASSQGARLLIQPSCSPGHAELERGAGVVYWESR